MTDTTLRIHSVESGSSNIDRSMKTLEETMRRMGLTGVKAFQAIEAVAEEAGEETESFSAKTRAAIGFARRMREEMDELNKETIFAKAQLNNKEFLRTLRQNEVAIQRLAHAAEPLRDRLDRTLETGNHLAGSLELVGSVGDRVFAILEATKAAAVMQDIAQSAERAGVNLERAQNSAGGLSSRAETGSLFNLVMQGGDQTFLGFLKGSPDLLDRINAAALRTGQSTQELTAALMDEVKSGEAGAAFKALGADSDILNIKVQRSVKEFQDFSIGGGLAVDRVWQAHKLLRAGIEDSEQTARRFAAEHQKAMERAENSVTDYADMLKTRAGLGLMRLTNMATTAHDSIAEVSANSAQLFVQFAKTRSINFGAAEAAEVAEIIERTTEAMRDGTALQDAISEKDEKRLATLTGMTAEGVRLFDATTLYADKVKVAEDIRAVGLLRERDRLEMAVAQIDAQLAQEAGLTRQEKKTLEIQKSYFAQQLSIANLSTTLEDLPLRKVSVLADGVRARFTDTLDAAQGIAPALANAATVGEKLAAIGGGISGALQGALFNALGGSQGEATAASTSSRVGGGSREDFSSLINQAALIGMTEDQRRLTEATQEWEASLERVGDNVDALDAANDIFADKTRQVFEDQQARLKAAADELAPILFGAIQAPLSAYESIQDSITARQEEKLAGLADAIRGFEEDAATSRRVSALGGGDIAARIDEAMQERDALLAVAGATADQRLAVEREYHSRISEMRQEQRLAEFDSYVEWIETQQGVSEQAAEGAAEMADMEFQRQVRIRGELETTSRAWIDYGSASQRGIFTAMEASKKGIIAARAFAKQSVLSARLVAQGQRSSSAAIIGGVGGALAAGGQVAAGLVQNEKAKAAILSASNAALAIQETAFGNIAGAALHTSAAIQFGILANISTPSVSSSAGAGVGAGAGRGVGGGGGSRGFGGGRDRRSDVFNTPTLAPFAPAQAPPIYIINNMDPITGENVIQVTNQVPDSGSGAVLTNRVLDRSSRRRRLDYA